MPPSVPQLPSSNRKQEITRVQANRHTQLGNIFFCLSANLKHFVGSMKWGVKPEAHYPWKSHCFLIINSNSDRNIKVSLTQRKVCLWRKIPKQNDSTAGTGQSKCTLSETSATCWTTCIPAIIIIIIIIIIIAFKGAVRDFLQSPRGLPASLPS